LPARSNLLAAIASAAVIFVGFVLALGPGACTCTLRACGDASSVTIEADLPIAFADLKKASLTMCRNSACGTLDLSQLGAAPMSGMDIHLGIGAPVSVTVGITVNGTLWLGSTWVDSSFSGGDVFTVTLTDTSGTAVISESDTAMSYENFYPNGESCPPTCSQRTFDHRRH
jgi:hypothetical protein